MTQTSEQTRALTLVAGLLAAILTPALPILPSTWAKENLIVPDGPQAGQPWDMSLTPYIIEPLDFMGPDSPVNEIAAMKGVQTGFTTLLIAMLGHSIDRDPCRMMLIQPTDSALSDFNREKLQPAIEGSKALNARVSPQTSRSSTGSTTYSKKYPGGSLTMAIASSAADLRSKTIKKMLRDEIDEYPDDLDGQGNPLEISDGRLTSFLAQGDWKKADISTPTIKGGSNIERRYLAGDQRRWTVCCPHCAEEFVFEFGPHFRFEKTVPHKAHYIAPCCGSVIEAHEKVGLVRKGRWIATAPRAGAFPSYHFDTLSSPFVPWDHIAKLAVDAGDDPIKLKSFTNLWLGLPYEIRGDAPDHEKLMSRRADWKKMLLPEWGLIVTIAADVQTNGIYYEVLAHGPDRLTLVIDADFLPGSTEGHDAGAFAALGEIYSRVWRNPWGGARQADAFAIDSGFRTHVVYAWVRSRPFAHAVKGADGWGRPAIGMPQTVDLAQDGRKIKNGAEVRLVGTWSLKAAFYEDLRKEEASGTYPGGFCHFGWWLEERYFRQITSEYLASEKFKGRERRFWKVRGGSENHFLDCRIYNLAMGEMLGLSRMTQDDWRDLAKQRGAPIDVDLFTPVKLAEPITRLPQPKDEQPVAPAPEHDAFAAFAALNEGLDAYHS